jgi:uncharacterized protein YukE
MKNFLALVLAAAALTACDNPHKAADALRTEIRAFRADPTDEKQAAIEQEFANLDARIDAMEGAGKAREAALLRDVVADLRVDFRTAKLARSLQDATDAIKGIGDAFRDAGRSVGDAIRSPQDSTTDD